MINLTEMFQNNTEEESNSLLGSKNPHMDDTLQKIILNTMGIKQNLKILMEDNNELKDRVKNLEEENSKMHVRLLTEVTSQRKNLQERKFNNILPKKPFLTLAELYTFEEKLQNSENMCAELEREILLSTISDPSKYIRSIWKKIFSDEVAAQCSWKGTTSKKCVMAMAITCVIRGAFNRKFQVDEKIFNGCSAKWFQTFQDRLNYATKPKTPKQ